jgi:proprotein convertase subtilisin/kexin type 2
MYGQIDYTFSDGGRKTQYQLSDTEVFSGGEGVPSAKTHAAWGGGKIYTLRSANAMKHLRSSPSADRKSMTPVFYDKSELPSAEKLAAMTASERAQRMAPARRLMTNRLLIHMDDSRYAELAATSPTHKEKSLIQGWMLVSYADSFTALDAAGWMSNKGNWEFTPVFSRMFEKRQALQRQVNDPLYPKQWHLDDGAPLNLHMKNTWDTFTGKGINIAVIDDGLEIKHEDLVQNAYPLESGYHRNFNDGPPADPSPLKAGESHGTKCAGLAAASGFNNVGVAGVAPEAMMMGLRLIAGDTADDASGAALAWQPDGLITHVSSNSWGPTDDGKAAGRASALQMAGIEAGATKNRGGLGTVYLISAGNGRDNNDESSYDEFGNSRFAIAVAAVGQDGKQSSYSENGVNVAISAFGGEYAPPNVMWTTDNSGDEASKLKTTATPTTAAPVNYTDSMNGTSAAAPQVSGAVALILQSNPGLGYRDVKEILMKSAIRGGLTGSDGNFIQNGGGFWFNNSFGAGLLNVAGAIALAQGWTNLGPIVTAEASNSDSMAIPDDGTPASMKLDLATAKIRVEHVEVTVTVKHANRGDVGFVVQSPGGMRSIVNNRPLDDAADFTDYTFTSSHHWGESAAGTWTVSAVDARPNGTSGNLASVKIKVYGSAQ